MPLLVLGILVGERRYPGLMRVGIPQTNKKKIYVCVCSVGWLVSKPRHPREKQIASWDSSFEFPQNHLWKKNSFPSVLTTITQKIPFCARWKEYPGINIPLPFSFLGENKNLFFSFLSFVCGKMPLTLHLMPFFLSPSASVSAFSPMA